MTDYKKLGLQIRKGKSMSEKGATSSRKKPAKATAIKSPEKSVFSDEKDRAYGYFLEGFLLIFFLYYFYKIYSFLGETHFWGDENVHAYISAVILKTHQIPFILPEEIYGMCKFSYPPFFHILGSFVMSVAGFSALKFVNLALLILFFVSFYTLIRGYYGRSEAIIASLLLSPSPVITSNALRFMTEMLSMLLVFLSFFFVLLGLKKSKKTFAILAGLSTGLLLLSKQVGFVVLGFYVILLVWFLLRKRKEVPIILIVVGVSAAVYMPYFVLAIFNNVDVFGFLSVLVGGAKEKPEWAVEAVKSFRMYDSALKEFGHHFYKGNGVVISISLLLPLYHFARVRTKASPEHYVFLMLICLAGAMVMWHITNLRHTIILLPLISFLVAYSFHRTAGKEAVIKAVTLLLLIIAFYSAYQMPNYRRRVNAPEEFRSIAKIIKRDSFTNGRVFCIYAFDILMYTGKPVIWPYPNLKDIPVELVEKQDEQEFYRLLRKYEIGYILLDSVFITKGSSFTGRGYPIYFHNSCVSLSKQGKISPIAQSRSKRFLLLKVT